MTETNAGVAIQDLNDLRHGVVGPPISSVEVKLHSVPDIRDDVGLPYLSSDKYDTEGNKIHGRGEILVRGPSVALGYYMMPEKTQQAFRNDGFFHTGDIGQFMNDGSIRIVDRVKNLVKLKGGEYVAIERMEMAYGNSKFVDAIYGGMCCYADGDMDRPIAIVQLSRPHAMAWAKQNNMNNDFNSLMESKQLQSAVLADMLKEHGKAGLSHLEKLSGVCLISDPWTAENGCLTAANKLQRKNIINQCRGKFEVARKHGIFEMKTYNYHSYDGEEKKME